MTENSKSTAEREIVQDIAKIFDKSASQDNRFSNPTPYPIKDKTRSNHTKVSAVTPPDIIAKTTHTPRSEQRLEMGLAITPYPELSEDSRVRKAAFNKSQSAKSSSAKAEKWEVVKTVALITTMVAGINAVSITIGYMNGQVSGLGSIIGTGIMFVVLFLTVMLSWSLTSFMSKTPVKRYYTRAEFEAHERSKSTSSLKNHPIRNV